MKCRHVLLFVVLYLQVGCGISFAQSIANSKRGSYKTFIYKIPADTAIKILKQSKILDPNLNSFLLFDSFGVGQGADELPVGHYLYVNVEDRKVKFHHEQISDLIIEALPDYKKVKLIIRKKRGEYVSNAVVTDGKRKVYYDEKANAYLLKPCKKDKERTILVETAEEKVLLDFYDDDNNRRYKPTFSDRVRSFGYRSKHRNKFEGKRIGYVVFNKPKYSLNDSVKLKAYFLKSDRKPLSVWVGGGYADNNLKVLKEKLYPVSKGAYLFDFLLSDSFKLDTRYQVVFKNHKSQFVGSGTFSTEDYLLDKTQSHFEIDKEDYFPKDSIIFNAFAKDFNGLYIMDGSIKITVTTSGIGRFDEDKVFVPDTLFVIQQKLNANADTRIAYSLQNLPKANFRLNVDATLFNSVNESFNFSKNASFTNTESLIETNIVTDTIYAALLQNGVSITDSGTVEIYRDDDVLFTKRIKFPYKEKIDQFADEYYFDTDSIIAETDFVEINKNEQLRIEADRNDTSVYFKIINPLKNPIYYSLYKGNSLFKFGSGVEVSELVRDNSKEPFIIHLQYVYNGKPKSLTKRIDKNPNTLEIQITQKSKIYPGQSDTVKIEVKDAKGKNVANTNLTAFSYNAQFGDTRLPFIPNFNSYKRTKLWNKKVSVEPTTFSENVELGLYKDWIQKFQLDTMLYYQLLFLKEKVKVHQEFTGKHMAEVALFVIQNGVEIPVHLIWLNNELMYFSGNEATTPYSFKTIAGYGSATLRIADRYVKIDSVYFPLAHKTIVVLNYDSLDKKVETILPTLSETEQKILSYRLIAYEPKREDGNVFLMQDDRVFKFSQDYNYKRIKKIIGPFKFDSVEFVSQNSYALKFRPETDYAYSFSPKTLRLEKIKLLDALAKNLKQKNKSDDLIRFNDAFEIPTNLFSKSEKQEVKFITTSQPTSYKSHENGIFKYELKSDSIFRYLRIVSKEINNYSDDLIHANSSSFKIQQGKYKLIFITEHLNSIEFENIEIKAKGTNFYRLKYDSTRLKSYLNKWILQNTKETVEYLPKHEDISIGGRILNSQDSAISFVKITITDSVNKIKQTAYSDNNGVFSFIGLPKGFYNLAITQFGYSDRKISNLFVDTQKTLLSKIELKKEMAFVLDEVKIDRERVGIIDQGKTSAGMKITKQDIVNLPTRNLSDIVVTSSTAYVGEGRGVSIGGAREDATEYYIDGVKVIGNLNASYCKEVNVVMIAENSLSVSAKFGDTIDIVKNVSGAQKLRSNFKDYGYWQPNLITDQEGKASFAVKFPDNITAWNSYVIAMNEKKKSGIATTVTRAYNDLSAEMVLPQFLIAGDTSHAYLKISNYTNRPIKTNAEFLINKELKFNNEVLVNKLLTDKIPIVADSNSISNDSLSAIFSIAIDNGYEDGEERKIPIFPVGVEEAKGFFVALKKDTTFTIYPDASMGKLTIHAESDLLSTLISEIDNLKKYPYSCIEQTASKLIALTMEEKVCNSLNKKFNGIKEKETIIKKLQKAQLYKGAYGWWEYAPANVFITTYVISALHKANPNLLKQAMFNTALYYLQSTFSLMNKTERIKTLELFAELDYAKDFVMKEVSALPFDSLSLNQKITVVRIEELAGVNNIAHWDSILLKQKATIFGGKYWDEDLPYWYKGQINSTLKVYQIAALKNNTDLQEGIIQYLLEKRSHNGWRNTAESAEILSTILPKVLSDRNGIIEQPTLKINNDSKVVSQFPFSIKLNMLSPVEITKTGIAPIYFTAYQKTFNTNPNEVKNDFEVKTHYERSSNIVSELNEGEAVELVTTINTKKYCEYLMVEIPIPAGCTYDSKFQSNSFSEVHREHFKNKVVIFCEKFDPGIQTFRMKLQPRYSGTYHSNPAKVELMYYPVFFGRNKMERVRVVSRSN